MKSKRFVKPAWVLWLAVMTASSFALSQAPMVGTQAPGFTG
jgi:hypothetical protein